MSLFQRLMKRLFGWNYAETRNALGSMSIRRIHTLPNGTRYFKGIALGEPVVMLPDGKVETHRLMCNGDVHSWKAL